MVCGTPRSLSQPPLLEYSSLPRNFSKLSFSFFLFLSFALKNLSFSLQLSRPIVEEPKKRERNGVVFWSSTWRSKGRREDLQNQVRSVPHRWQRRWSQARYSLFSYFLFIFIDFYTYSIWLRRVWFSVIIQSLWL